MTQEKLKWPHISATDTQGVPEPHVWLRLLETTDVHAHLFSYDYDRDEEVDSFGLTRAATVIRQARKEAAHTLLFDNGDFLQGSALGDLIASYGVVEDVAHPVIEAMNCLGYDAACLGNHEFNFGLHYLENALSAADFPIVCANATTVLSQDAPWTDHTFMAPFMVKHIDVHDSHGNPQTVTIGVIGLVPPQIAQWDYTHLHNRLYTRDMVDAARSHVPALRQAGAELIITLAHTGISEGKGKPFMENAALELARNADIDIVMAGHSHQVFPDPTAKHSDPDIDHVYGTLSGKPTVMAGYRGSHVGVIDICLMQQKGSWRVVHHESQVRAVKNAVPDAELTQVVRVAHQSTLSLITQPIGETKESLHSYLVQYRPDVALSPVLLAQQRALKTALQHTEHSEIPVLSAAAGFKSGGRAGPSYYTDIARGPITWRQIHDLYPFPNNLVGVRVTGLQLIEWLERAASCFHRLRPGERRQAFWNEGFPGHAFDTIFGVSYQIDLSQPPRFNTEGELLDENAHRITQLRYQDAPVRADQHFAIATNNFRAFGGGPYNTCAPKDVLVNTHRPIRDLIANLYIEGELTQAMPRAQWSFVAMPDTSVLIETGPGLRAHVEDLRQLNAKDLGDNEAGFACFEIPLRPTKACESLD